MPRLVVLNLPRTREETDEGATLLFADGRAMPFRDAAFDVVFSNSVIEHLGDEESQRRFAGEVARVGRGFW
ncbi:MAG: methyltransferase domain-containing protein, partial [Bryobacteraceae bacterium]